MAFQVQTVPGSTDSEKLAMQPGIAEICRPGAVESLFKSLHSSSDKHLGKAAWTLLFYGLWHNANILGRPSDANVLDSL